VYSSGRDLNGARFTFQRTCLSAFRFSSVGAEDRLEAPSPRSFQGSALERTGLVALPHPMVTRTVSKSLA